MVFIGYFIDQMNNPADFFLDAIMGAEPRNPAFGSQAEPLTEVYDKSRAKAVVDARLAEIWHDFSGSRHVVGQSVLSHRVWEYKASFKRQVKVTL